MKTFRSRPLIALLLTVCALAIDLLCPFGRFLRRASRHPLFRPVVAAAALFVLALMDHRLALAAPIAIGTLTEGRHTGEFILSEAEGTGSRDTVTVTVAANTTLSAGTVLGQISATGKYVPYDDSYTDGREDAAAILYDNVTNDAGAPADISAVVINWSAEVRSADLVYVGDVDEDKAVSDLRALGVKARS